MEEPPLFAIAPEHVQSWYSLSWPEWVGVVGVALTVPALVLTLVSLRLARAQLDRTETAAQAAASAVAATQSRLVENQLLAFAIPQLRATADALGVAAVHDERALAIQMLGAWRWQAGQVAGLLRADSDGAHDQLVELQESLTFALLAEEALVKDDGGVVQHSEQARHSIATACVRLAEYAAGRSIELD